MKERLPESYIRATQPTEVDQMVDDYFTGKINQEEYGEKIVELIAKRIQQMSLAIPYQPTTSPTQKKL